MTDFAILYDVRAELRKIHALMMTLNTTMHETQIVLRDYLQHAASPQGSAMGNYVLGSAIHLRGIYWSARLSVIPTIVGSLFTTPQAHGLTNGQTVALLDGAVGGLSDRDAYNQFQVYVVIAGSATTFQLSYPGGSALALSAANPGIISVLADPTIAALIITPFDTVPLPVITPNKEQVGVYFYDYVTTERGPNGSYKFSGTAPVQSASQGSFSVS